MGNKCTTGAIGRQRICLMERHTLTEEQMVELDHMFRKAAKGSRCISFQNFLDLYPESKMVRDELDMRSVFHAVADPRTNSIEFGGFVRLMLLSNRVGSIDEVERMRALFSVMDPADCKSIRKTDFFKFVRSIRSSQWDHVCLKTRVPEQEIETTVAIDGVATEDAVINFDEFREFCATETDTYKAICCYLFPM